MVHDPFRGFDFVALVGWNIIELTIFVHNLPPAEEEWGESKPRNSFDGQNKIEDLVSEN
jgi:hypothetical protein